VAIEYFTKWIEAESLAIITVARVQSFIFKNIMCRFGIPNQLITDNGTQFTNKKFRDWLAELKISEKGNEKTQEGG